MTWNVCTHTTPMARKTYVCEAADFIWGAGWTESDVTAEEWDTIMQAKAEGWKILPGTRYVKLKGIWEGAAVTFRAREDLDAICQKYDLYEE